MLKIELQFTERGLAKEGNFYVMCYRKKIYQPILEQCNREYNTYCVVLPPLLSPFWIVFPMVFISVIVIQDFSTRSVTLSDVL